MSRPILKSHPTMYVVSPPPPPLSPPPHPSLSQQCQIAISRSFHFPLMPQGPNLKTTQKKTQRRLSLISFWGDFCFPRHFLSFSLSNLGIQSFADFMSRNPSPLSLSMRSLSLVSSYTGFEEFILFNRPGGRSQSG